MLCLFIRMLYKKDGIGTESLASDSYRHDSPLHFISSFSFPIPFPSSWIFLIITKLERINSYNHTRAMAAQMKGGKLLRILICHPWDWRDKKNVGKWALSVGSSFSHWKQWEEETFWNGWLRRCMIRKITMQNRTWFWALKPSSERFTPQLGSHSVNTWKPGNGLGLRFTWLAHACNPDHGRGCGHGHAASRIDAATSSYLEVGLMMPLQRGHQRGHLSSHYIMAELL